MKYSFIEGLNSEGVETMLHEMRNCELVSMGHNSDGFWMIWKVLL